jgi:PKD repeat protein
MKKIFLLLFFICALCIANCAFSQSPLVKKWDKRFGSTDIDYLYSFEATTDGGYILNGTTWAGIGGDKTQPSWGYYDIWIVKIDSIGTKQWDRRYGGTALDQAFSLHQTRDGGYIMAGRSGSGIGGDKTEASWGGEDGWIVKIDSLGNKQWDKRFGGLDNDYFFSILELDDGGYIAAGSTFSGVSGDITQPLIGVSDYWIVRIDSVGNKIWDKRLGGFKSDMLYDLQQTAEGGFILGGRSLSDTGGDKTQNNWSIDISDFWIVKTDSIGNKQWDRRFGGTDDDRFVSVQQTDDGGYTLGGWSSSGISGDKTQDVLGYSDYWTVKIDSLGNKQWDRRFGGLSTEDDLGSILQTWDGGFLVAGSSYSPISGEKTEYNLGPEQTWVIKTDTLGNIQWDKTILTTGHDEQGLAIQTVDGCYIIANVTNGGIGGYKTQPSQGDDDFWIIKFCDTTFIQANLASTPNLCPGGCTDFINLSLNATSYQWFFYGGSPDTSTSVNPTNICYANPGNYDVQLIATNSFFSDTLLLTDYITVYPAPLPQGILQIADTLFANPGAASYQWYYNGNTIPGATDYFYVATISGDYNVVATDQNGCEVEAVINNVIAASSQLAVGNWQLAIIPNPVIDKFTIQNLAGSLSKGSKGTTVEISVYNVMGEKINLDVDLRQCTVDCRSLIPGIYYLEISSEKAVYKTKFVKL